ncbi:cytosine-specific methyltransferase [Clostridia bacterium]|nr:cytosine-specific methyltransferase [Clostridia bacterium]
MVLTQKAQTSPQIALWDIEYASKEPNDAHKHAAPIVGLTTAPRGISLFTGAGGMDVGFTKAGIEVIMANELIPYACDTYAANHPDTELLRGDINEHLDAFAEGKADIVFGGPPCQGFSVAGKMDPDDERSKLIWTFLDVVKRVQPQLFVMENVKALGALEKWQHIRERFLDRARAMGYYCDYFLVNAAEFGVSQNRERVFFIGSKKPYDSIAFGKELSSLKQKPKTLRQLFATLQPAGSDENPLTCTAKITLAANPVMRRSPYAGMIFNGMGRPLNLDSVSTTLPASMGGNKTPIVDDEVLQDSSATDWIKSYHARLWENAEEACYAPAPEQLRRLTIVESAAIQSFPPDYKFCGTKSAVYTQIGNAVPCKLAQCVAEAVLKFFY